MQRTIEMAGCTKVSGVSFGFTVAGCTCFEALKLSTSHEVTLRDVCKDIAYVPVQTRQLVMLQGDFSS